jgi:glycosyltransferase involved in cell wall biosynthesis
MNLALCSPSEFAIRLYLQTVPPDGGCSSKGILNSRYWFFMPHVSVILPSYNSASYLGLAIDSVINQTYSDWEIVLVDDGSVDDTHAVVNEHASRLVDRLRYIYQPNQGLSAARNTAMRNARGELFALLDSDDVWLPARLEEGVAAMDKNPEAGLVHGKVMRIDATGSFLDAPECDTRYLSGNIAQFIYTRKAHILCPTAMFRRQCVAELGGFDESMRSVEDRDMWFRIAERWPVVYINKVVAHYRLSGAGMSENLDRMLAWQKYFVKKHRFSSHVSKRAFWIALASIYRERGDRLFDRKQPLRAIVDYSTSVLCNPFDWQNAYMLARAIVKPF